MMHRRFLKFLSRAMVTFLTEYRKPCTRGSSDYIVHFQNILSIMLCHAAQHVLVLSTIYNLKALHKSLHLSIRKKHTSNQLQESKKWKTRYEWTCPVLSFGELLFQLNPSCTPDILFTIQSSYSLSHKIQQKSENWWR